MCKYILFPKTLCMSNAVLFLLQLIVIIVDDYFYNIKLDFKPVFF